MNDWSRFSRLNMIEIGLIGAGGGVVLLVGIALVAFGLRGL